MIQSWRRAGSQWKSRYFLGLRDPILQWDPDWSRYLLWSSSFWGSGSQFQISNSVLPGSHFLGSRPTPMTNSFSGLVMCAGRQFLFGVPMPTAGRICFKGSLSPKKAKEACSFPSSHADCRGNLNLGFHIWRRFRELSTQGSAHSETPLGIATTVTISGVSLYLPLH